MWRLRKFCRKLESKWEMQLAPPRLFIWRLAPFNSMKNTQTGIAQAANELVAKFPLTYYGLIAFEEVNKQLPQYENQKLKPAKLYFSQNEWDALDRAKILLSAGLLDEASEELAPFYSRELSADESIFLAGLYARSLHYQRAFSLISKALDLEPERRSEYLVHLLFPKEYWE